MVPLKLGKNIHSEWFFGGGELDSPNPSQWVPPWTRHLGRSCSQPAAPNPYRCPCAWPRTPEGKPQKIPPIKTGDKNGIEIGIMGFFVPFFIMNVECFHLYHLWWFFFKSFTGKNLKCKKTSKSSQSCASKRGSTPLTSATGQRFKPPEGWNILVFQEQPWWNSPFSSSLLTPNRPCWRFWPFKKGMSFHLHICSRYNHPKGSA